MTTEPPSPRPRIAAVIVAAGRGVRAGAGLPKQYRPIRGKAVLAHTLGALRSHPLISEIVMVLGPEDDGLFAAHVGGEVRTVTGGPTRAASVRAGLEALAGRGVDLVLIHDAARPLLPHVVIDRVLVALTETPAAAPALAVTDALWRGAEGRVTGVEPREGLFRAQTPQGFHFEAILAAHRAHAGEAADDVAVARAAGLDVAIVEGDEANMKITGPDDFARAERLMGGAMDLRLGHGYDVHRFGPGDHVMLCGVAVPHGRALQGHSDADVAMHAITDALYGALAEGDIGRHFPPSDPKWKGAESHVFLRHAVDLAARRGFAINNIDCTIICETPRIGPHAEAMRARLAEITGLEAGRISVKATTSERLGFTGREEGIAATATAALVHA
ncbi:bifunctional 2-C-methyl-D-erythritol 4-phosphate cytidylyltransferase/2-C-methyl-D-erythritol 2,4-cyclodiphosphate synthase [Maritimibacter sp. 55A14]|uniref:bifunctional 2-C-methyl-D-erythritol 4-phosphate cytidylyltransferase/2-C-methyl-D-erythritol 2,4-cyclodiphosphate synthase n=1 Tax=Maritimibacter sp. 55A14 TaxID=2174844 RepID=UPI000D61C443|nr:bifunctional 2-C-methyl-D-erythritol 4-phosphate cytidylyltransferase/2-C-methyl-D-erythritol 2,4-cyclodiphosphate synthase [Maritimibacter sp. 55A14]PWE33146.1 bifunctional 2-C-methyl-D-erythritol 4-phosphate cytidylyltransferase/2-C-methyl-D-erythritol 2,4-cyclodiphosphate synthase [Maritimibacter sp. 55A14]